MNQIFNVIKSRRSVRRYLPEQIKEEELNAIIEAGTYAPSGHNCQPWHFTVIQNKLLIESMNEKIKQQMILPLHKWANKMGASDQYNVFHHAPTVVIVSGDKTATSPLPLAGTDFHYTPLVDCAAAIENILLAAESLGIGSCWLGLVNFFFELPEVRELGIPDSYQPYFAVALGYKDAGTALQPAPKRRTGTVSYIR
ncbi:nitroreductase family protein [Pectinatus haikarae]|uniref:nitroreductase family protein n=1 Tax=Pectinatus haikarae TaxID=349096 RepID=UPI0018C72792|nr:nitroreductase [Pectinatus haikarae]